jgi:hypothetical protein
MRFELDDRNVRDVRRFVDLIFTRDPAVYSLHGIDPPRLRPEAYAQLAREAYGRHALLPSRAPEDLLEAEGFVLVPMPGARCGVSTRDWVAIRRGHDWMLAMLLCHHERTHGWAKRIWMEEYTEADVWLATAEMALPGSWRRRGEWLLDHPYLPRWFLALALEIEAA